MFLMNEIPDLAIVASDTKSVGIIAVHPEKESVKFNIHIPPVAFDIGSFFNRVLKSGHTIHVIYASKLEPNDTLGSVASELAQVE